MKNILAPKYLKPFDNQWVFWFEKSNTYSVVDDSFKLILDLYFNSISVEEFILDLKNLSIIGDVKNDEIEILSKIDSYLKQCNTNKEEDNNKIEDFDDSKRNFTKYYKILDNVVKVNFDSEYIKKTLHPAISYLEVEQQHYFDVLFDVYKKDAYLYLFKNEKLLTKVKTDKFHFIQGKFVTHLIGEMHNKIEDDWIGTFHGSTVSDSKTAIMLIGLSGKGKSTLTTILAASGLELVADDVTPLLAKDLEFYNNPSAVSIKKGAFKTLESLIEGFSEIPAVTYTEYKGEIKHVPFPKYKKLHYPCKAIVLANYTVNAETKLRTISVKEILETLIPDSWLFHSPEYAVKFLNWLGQLEFYEITYSNNNEAIATINSIFKDDVNLEQ